MMSSTERMSLWEVERDEAVREAAWPNSVSFRNAQCVRKMPLLNVVVVLASRPHASCLPCSTCVRKIVLNALLHVTASPKCSSTRSRKISLPHEADMQYYWATIIQSFRTTFRKSLFKYCGPTKQKHPKYSIGF